MEIDFQPSQGPFLSALEAAAWYLGSTVAFSAAVHLPMPQRLWLSPVIVLLAALSFTRVESLEPLLPEFDILWCFTVVTYTFHVVASLYIEQWKLPLRHGAARVDFIAAYKIWNNPRRLPPLQEQPVTGRQRFVFAASRAATSLLLWLFDRHVAARAAALLEPTPQDFAPQRQYYLPHITTKHQALLRLFVSVSWIWRAYLLLTVANAAAATLFVAVLRLDFPDEWPPLFGDPREAYTLRRFWSVFWHRILQAPHTSYGRLAAQRLLKLKPGSHAYKAFIAFYLFAASAVSHTLVNWQTGALGPLLGDARFLMVNFLAAFVEAWVCRALGPRLRFLPCYVVRAVGFAWVLSFFYCAAPPWQFAIVYDF